MAIVKKSALVQYSAKTMFDLVNDIKAYPEFLPWCSNAKIISQTNQQIEARVYLKIKGLEKSFATRNNLTHSSKIDIHLIDGPFKVLQGSWYFQELNEQASKISLELEYEFSGPLISIVLSPIFNQIANTFVDSFCSRAKQLYG